MNPAIRQSICATCDALCAVRETIDHREPAASCPVGKWKEVGWRNRNRPAPEMPPLAEQAANAASALVRVTKATIRREPVRADLVVIQARQAICEACPELVKGKCAKCGCFYKIKILLATEQCPIGKWPLATLPRTPRETFAEPSPSSPPLVGEAPPQS